LAGDVWGTPDGTKFLQAFLIAVGTTVFAFNPVQIEELATICAVDILPKTDFSKFAL
jgi:hypothetical protein